MGKQCARCCRCDRVLQEGIPASQNQSHGIRFYKTGANSWIHCSKVIWHLPYLSLLISVLNLGVLSVERCNRDWTANRCSLRVWIILLLPVTESATGIVCQFQVNHSSYALSWMHPN